MPRRAAAAALTTLACFLAAPDSASAAASAAASLRALVPPTGPPPPRLSDPPTPPANLNTFRFTNPSSSHSSHSSSAHGAAGPTPDDFDLADIALVTTLDGRVHALRRETGQWVWTLHDPASKGAGWVGEPLVSAGGRSSATNGSRSGNDVSKFPSSGDDGGRTTDGRSTSGLGDEEDDEVYAIEPHSDGDIYVFVRTPSSDGSPSRGGNLQKLPLSVSQLVALSPFTFPGDSSRIFVGKKETRLVGVDLKTGKLVGVFGPNEGWCEWKDDDRKRIKTEECDDRIESRPEDLLYMGRTDYIVSIFSKTGVLLQTLRYSNYGPSTLSSTVTSVSGGTPDPSDFSSLWTRTPDERYLEPMHDGNLVCFQAGANGGNGGLQWRNAFDCPVVGVFDVAYLKADRQQDREATQPHLFSQPRPLPTAGVTPPGAFDSLHQAAAPDRAFVGRHGDSYFAMSSGRYPLIAFAPPAEAAAAGFLDGEEEGSDAAEAEGRADGRRGGEIVGSHMLASPERPAKGGNLIEEGEGRRLGIDPPPASTTDETVPTTIPAPPSQPMQRAAQISSMLARRVQEQLSLSSGHRDPISGELITPGGNPVLSVLFVTIFVGWLLARRAWGPKWGKELGGRARAAGRNWFGVGAGEMTPEEQREAEQQKAIDELLGEDDPSPPVDAAPGRSILLKRPTPNGVAINSTSAVAPPVDRVSQHVRIASLDKALPPVPVAQDDEADSEAEGDEKGEEKDDAENGKPKRPRRVRKRGRRPGQKAAAVAAAAAAAVEAGALGTGALDGEPPTRADALAADLERLKIAPNGVADKGLASPVGSLEPYRIGSLVVTDETLGYGSHGTVVVRGTFQGREVAVKRLLKDFVTLASHEVSLLQESDDHPNVVRYFVKESRDNFLYIALELCPASLFDVVERPKTFPDLEAAFVPKRALRQITAGLHHLHKLKIVHRDIKPQNILVAPARGGGLRMLISDFGLCKKLEVDESSFAQTANHAAGSFGYRAPEILRGQVNPNDQTATPSSSTQGSLNGDSPNGSLEAAHRLTRSIDIFSLGCIFYYVMTKGEHPFGNRYEREVNILRNEVCLDLLDGLDAESYEIQDLIRSMVHDKARARPTAEEILQYPCFWTPARRLLFLCDASDRFEIMERDPPAPPLVTLEEPTKVASVVGTDWVKKVDRALIDNLGKYRKYDAGSVRDLLRVLRNKKHHFQDLPDALRKSLGELPDGFLEYFTHRFPSLLLHVYGVVQLHLRNEPMFKSYWETPGD